MNQRLCSNNANTVSKQRISIRVETLSRLTTKIEKLKRKQHTEENTKINKQTCTETPAKQTNKQKQTNNTHHTLKQTQRSARSSMLEKIDV